MESPWYVTITNRRAKINVGILLFLFLLVTDFRCTSKPRRMESRASVKGILLDHSGKPIENAVVMIVSGSHDVNDIASVSNENGEFYISNIVIPGKYVLQIQGEKGTIKKEVDIKNKDTIIKISL